MSDLAVVGTPVNPKFDLTPRARWAMNLPDAQVPWWAIALLDLEPRGPHTRVRRAMQLGHRSGLNTEEFWGAWAEVIEMAQVRVMTKPMQEWVEEAHRQTDLETGTGAAFTNIVRDAALSSPRAFCQFCNITDDDGNVFILKDFHLRTLRAMRGVDIACILLPFEHGKSALGSLVVPLMDWAEWPECTQGRIYLSSSHEKKWIRRLMGHVEHNSALHKLFPWVRKPIKGDAGYRVWSTAGFAIGGRTLGDLSFEPLTVKAGHTGNRYHRVGNDDWVTSRNARSVPEQEQFKEYLFTGPMTMPQTTTHVSKYGTKFPSIYHCGTLFDANDVNVEAFTRFQELGHTALRFDVYPGGNPKRGVIWPELRGEAWVAAKKRELGVRNFNMRCRNIVGGTARKVFPPEKVAYAECDGTNGRPPYTWMVVPPFVRTIIGFDPGSGKITRDSKNPAVVVYGKRIDQTPILLRDDRGDHSPEDVEWHHIIQWERLEGYSFTQQCDKLADLARFYGCPVAVEDNNIQTAYADYLRKVYPGVNVICHTTGLNKRDPKQGVEQFEPLFVNDRVLIHAKDAPLHELLGLRTELTTYPGKNTDLVMAMWIARFQMEMRDMENRDITVTRTVPSYVSRYNRRVYSMSRG